MRAAIYTRVSSDMQMEGWSLEAQAEACQKFVEGKGWELVRLYRDERESGKTVDRPKFQEMLEDARAGQFDVIVTHKLDRFSRSVTDILLTLRELERDKVSYSSASEQFDFTTPIGRVFLVLLAAFAQWYLDNLAAETAKGHRARAATGMWNSALPYGYYAAYMKDGGDGLAHIDESQAEGVKYAFELYSTGRYSVAEVARALQEAGYRPAGRHGKRSLSFWSKDSMATLLQNRFYAGYVQYRGDWIKGLHEPIISEELFEQVQQARQGRAHNAPGISQKRRDFVYLLSGLARCAHCGNPLRGMGSKYGNFKYYSCYARQRGHVCEGGGAYLRVADVEEALARRLRAIRLPSNWQELIKEGVRAQDAKPTQDTTATRARLEGQLEREKNLYRLGDITEAEYVAERNRIREELAKLAPPPPAAKLAAAADVLQNFGSLWDSANRKNRRALVRSLLSRIDLDNTGAITKLEPRGDFATLFHYSTSPV